MNRLSSRSRLVAGVSAAVILIAGIVLAVSSGGTGHRKAPATAAGRTEIALAAEYLGVAPAALRRDLRSGSSLAEIARATPGRSVQGLVQRLVAARVAQLRAAGGGFSPSEQTARVAALRAAVTARVRRSGLVVARVVAAGDLIPAAEYLGIDVLRLRGDLEAGRTLAQVAQATPGRSTAGLISALVATRTARLRAALRTGAMSSSQEEQLASRLTRRVTAEVRAQNLR